MESKLAQNEVSIFLAAYMAGLVQSGRYTESEVRHYEYTSVEFGNHYRKLLLEYQSGVDHESGLNRMFELIKNGIPF